MFSSSPPKRPRPKYQVFISSTFLDLHEERRAVTWEILKARHIPAGMENFTATDDRGWRTIQRSIDLSDYYVLIVAGAYGSVDPNTSLSWTEREYRYAREKSMRVMAFIRLDAHITADKLEKSEAGRSQLAVFKASLRESHLCETWSTLEDLKSKVMQALQNQIADDEDSGAPRPGWFRGDEITASPAALDEFARLSAENAELKERLRLVDEPREHLELETTDGEPIADVELVAPIIRVMNDPAFNALTALHEPHSRDVQRYAQTRVLTVWLVWRLKNSGKRPARNVVVDLSASNVSEAHVHEIERPVGSLSRFPSISPIYYNSSEHVYVEHCRARGGSGQVRQRIKQVAAGGSEELIAVGFVAAPDLVEGAKTILEIAYSARSEDGLVTAGGFSARVTVAESRSLTKSDVLGRDV